MIEPILLEHKGYKLLDVGSTYFRDKIKIDWGSFAWKCTAEEIMKFLEHHQETLIWLIGRDQAMMNWTSKRAIQKENIMNI